MDPAEGSRRRIRCQGSSLPPPFRHQRGPKGELNNHLDKIQNAAPLYLPEKDTHTLLDLGSRPPSHPAPATMAAGGEGEGGRMGKLEVELSRIWQNASPESRAVRKWTD